MVKKFILATLLMLGLNGFSAPTYKIYTAVIYQVGNTNPAVHVLENTIGTINWTRINTGYYKAFKYNAFPLNKTWISITGDFNCSFVYGSTSDLIITTRGSNLLPKDGIMMYGAFIEIRVYTTM